MATRRRRLRPELVFLLVPLLVVATVVWRYWNQRRQEYPLIVERGRTEGIPALDEGNFVKAHQLLSAAKSAVDALGGAVEGADAIRDAADEAAIFVDLGPLLEDLLAEAGRTDPDTWASRFATLYKGRSVFFDTWIDAVPDEGTSSRYELAYRILPPGEATSFRDVGSGRPDRIGVIDLTGFELFELARPANGSRVIFGGRLASFKYDSESDLWLIRLEPKSGVFLKHEKALEAAGRKDENPADRVPEGRP